MSRSARNCEKYEQHNIITSTIQLLWLGVISKMLYIYLDIRIFGSCALSGKMLLLRFVENNKIDAYIRAG